MSGPSPAERAEVARTRRRWITLAELVAVAGVLIAGLTLYLNWSERRADDAGRRAEASAGSRYTIGATVGSGGDLVLAKDDRHPLADVRVRFPAALGIAPQTSLTQRIERDWYAGALLKATDGGADERSGKLPVSVSVDYWDGDAKKTASGRFDIVWRTEGRMLRGRSLTIEGLQRAGGAADQKALNAAWAGSSPRR